MFGNDLNASRGKVGEMPAPLFLRHFAVDMRGPHAASLEQIRDVLCVLNARAKDDRLPVRCDLEPMLYRGCVTTRVVDLDGEFALIVIAGDVAHA